MGRLTKQKEAIRTVLNEENHPLLPDEIHSIALQTVPSLGIATVYRSLKNLKEEGYLCCVEIPGQPPRYERSNKAHHHHFHCQECHSVYDLESCVDGIMKLAPIGFKVTHHEIILHGLCKSCA